MSKYLNLYEADEHRSVNPGNADYHVAADYLAEADAEIAEQAKRIEELESLRAKVEAHNEKAFLDCTYSACMGSKSGCTECGNLINLGDSDE